MCEGLWQKNEGFVKVGLPNKRMNPTPLSRCVASWSLGKSLDDFTKASRAAGPPMRDSFTLSAPHQFRAACWHIVLKTSSGCPQDMCCRQTSTSPIHRMEPRPSADTLRAVVARR